MTDPVGALAERLRDVPNIHSSECAILDAKPCDCITFPAYELLACAALAFVAERLPANVLTSEDHAAIQLVIHDQADNRPSSISLTGTLLGIVDRLDALLHDLRGRLGGKS